MLIYYKNKTVEQQFNPEYQKKWKYSPQVAEKIKSAENYIRQAESLLDVKNFPPFHFHQMKGKRKGEWSISLGKTGYRVTMIPCDDDGNEILSGDVIAQCRSIKIVLVTEVSNHYE